MLPECIVGSLNALMTSNGSVMKVYNERLSLFVSLISNVNQLNRYRVQQDLVLVVFGTRYVMVRSPTKQICNVHLGSLLIDK